MGVAVYLLFSLYAIRWFLIGQLGLDFHILAEHKDVLLYVLSGTFGSIIVVFLFFTWSYMRSENTIKRLLTTSLNILIILGIPGSLVWYYSLHLYPDIPAVFGGGRSEPIVLWFREEGLSMAVLERLHHSICVTKNSSARCEGLYLFHMGKKYAIFTDAKNDATNAILIPGEKIQEISW
ncbi:hypothetical protein bplSymb_SCF16101P004 [Bathymodiolus platifrons methanotrophic gill symbiont]|uniref:hypothetical protein n=1 Tax=Bathymodiolus platifrons methanotrophic gill symbiont TaxID=113268 RepID=UPI000B412375|nr:hypothetical protein [Bathymodiolus platifrons methanotrophic gill symbiont]GAW87765.1 hypothetical protein bplSymb_SCF16101P004 [Bathymodiolus platifrons methanotrophic gill symbiont]GFO77580.1 hypothetical protein BPLS_P6105 [Bathymodiolus platifrons methanotrophic gill symbiont]